MVLFRWKYPGAVGRFSSVSRQKGCACFAEHADGVRKLRHVWRRKLLPPLVYGVPGFLAGALTDRTAFSLPRRVAPATGVEPLLRKRFTPNFFGKPVLSLVGTRNPSPQIIPSKTKSRCSVLRGGDCFIRRWLVVFSLVLSPARARYIQQRSRSKTRGEPGGLGFLSPLPDTNLVREFTPLQKKWIRKCMPYKKGLTKLTIGGQPFSKTC